MSLHPLCCAKADSFSEYGAQERLQEFTGLTDEYLDKMIELGYIMLFSAACPVLAAIALVCSTRDAILLCVHLYFGCRCVGMGGCSDVGRLFASTTP